jgi:hypothetical protein
MAVLNTKSKSPKDIHGVFDVVLNLEKIDFNGLR